MKLEVVCPYCGHDDFLKDIENNFKCNKCRATFSQKHLVAKEIYSREEKFSMEINKLLTLLRTHTPIVINNSEFEILELSHDDEYNLKLELYYKGE